MISPVEQFGPLPEKSIWPSIYRLLGEQIRQHRSTIVFANNRRTVERITAHLNATGGGGEAPPWPAPITAAWPWKSGRQPSRPSRKAGCRRWWRRLRWSWASTWGRSIWCARWSRPATSPAACSASAGPATSSGRQSKGRLIPKTPADLLEQAVLAREMAAGRVEEDPRADQLPRRARPAGRGDGGHGGPGTCRRSTRWSAGPTRTATCRPRRSRAVLEMVSGRYPLQRRASQQRHARRWPPCSRGLAGTAFTIACCALPGSQQLALVSGGTIPDTGQYAAYTSNGVRIGELDEEFIYERRVGDAFLLGTNAWRLERIEADRVIVSPAEGCPAMVPFWHGETGGPQLRPGPGHRRSSCASWRAARRAGLSATGWSSEFFLDAAAARNLRHYVRRQLASSGCLPTDRTLIVEASRDPLGDWQVILLSPLGQPAAPGPAAGPGGPAARAPGLQPQCLHHDDGILIRLADTDEPVLDLFEGLTPENVEDVDPGASWPTVPCSRCVSGRTRPGPCCCRAASPGKRAPLWLQRLRGRDLLQVARRHPDFPIVAETFRECLHDHLDLPRLQQLLADIRDGRVEVVTRRAEAPSPFAAGLLFAFTAAFMYQDDRTEAERGRPETLDQQLLEQLVAPGAAWPSAGSAGHPPGRAPAARPGPAAAQQHGDGRMAAPPRRPDAERIWKGRWRLPGGAGGRRPGRDSCSCRAAASRERWVGPEEAELYRQAFGLNERLRRQRRAPPVRRVKPFCGGSWTRTHWLA